MYADNIVFTKKYLNALLTKCCFDADVWFHTTETRQFIAPCSATVVHIDLNELQMIKGNIVDNFRKMMVEVKRN